MCGTPSLLRLGVRLTRYVVSCDTEGPSHVMLACLSTLWRRELWDSGGVRCPAIILEFTLASYLQFVTASQGNRAHSDSF